MNLKLLQPSGTVQVCIGIALLCLIFVDSQYGTCFVSRFWRLEFGDGS